MYVKIGGQYKYGIPWIKVGGVWRCGTYEYINDGGFWQWHSTFDIGNFSISEVLSLNTTEKTIKLNADYSIETERLFNQFTLNSDGTVSVNRTGKYKIESDISVSNWGLGGLNDAVATTCNFKLYSGSTVLINNSFSVPVMDGIFDSAGDTYSWTGTITAGTKLKATAKLTKASPVASCDLNLHINGMPS